MSAGDSKLQYLVYLYLQLMSAGDLTLQYLVSLFTADERWRFNITVSCHLYLQLMSAVDLTLQYLVSLFIADERWRFNITVSCHLYLQLMSAGDLTLQYSGDPVSDRLTKRTIPEYEPPFFSPKYFPIHIMYNQIQKADRLAIRDTDHHFSVSNHKRTRKTDQQKKIIFTFTVIYASINGPAAAGFTNGTSCSWIQLGTSTGIIH